MSQADQSSAKSQAATKTKRADAPAAQRFTLKGQRRDWHHLFKADVRPMKKNVSFQKGQPRIEELEHTHLFHTVNSQLKPQKHSSTVGGHFHELEWAVGADGIPKVVKCGPPMTYRYVSKPGGQKKRQGAVKWRDMRNEDGDEHVFVEDKHTHTFKYIHSEELQERAGRPSAPSLEQDMKAAGIEDRSA